jgi:hypothetical protein
LPTAQLAYNNTVISTTGILSFFANYGCYFFTLSGLRGLEPISEQTKIKVNKIKELHQELFRDIKWILQRTAMYYNKSKLKGSRFREGDLVYLLRRNIKTTRPSDKLNYKKFGLFKVKRNIKDISYELYLLPTIRIHSVFHISLLELADSDTSAEPALEIYSDL